MRVSNRIRTVGTPPIPRIMESARKIRESGGSVFSMAQAAPWFGPPPEALARLRSLLDERGTHSYTPDEGLASARMAVARDFEERRGIALDSSRELHLTCGASQAFLSALISVTDPGDPVVLLEPWYFDHEFAIRYCGLEPRSAVMGENPGGWGFPKSLVGAELDRGARAVVLVNPGNPTGCVLDEGELRWLCRATREAGCFLLVDETYERFNFTGSRWHPWTGRVGENSHVLTFGSFSKSLGVPGWRIGYLFGHADIMSQALKVQDSAVICPPAPAQILVEAALTGCPGWIEERSREVRERLVACRSAVGLARGLEWREPGGAFFSLARLTSGEPSVDAAHRLLETYGIAAIPGSAFGPAGEGHLRLSFGCLSDEEMRPALEALASADLS
ncbi:pyridoxal phosphate-dependent aminotransferase [Candidatus Fermentibacterales bacterium]|nr:pyridoxal phosphate-dependent aminotransferase [Candidatus Fermentibacterales bacterium]